MSEEYPHYSMIIEWSAEDQAYIVTVPELPGCRTHGASYVEAAQHGQEALEGWVDVARAQGETLPSVCDFAQRWQQELEALPPDVRAEYEVVRQGEES